MTLQSRFSVNAKSGAGEIYLYDVIGEGFFSEGITATSFKNELKKLGDVSVIKLYINSPGGVVDHANAIFNQLMEHKARVEGEIHGIAASAASVVAQAADTLSMAGNGIYMIHKPVWIAIGNADEMRKSADILDQYETTIIKAYRRRVKMSDDELTQMLADETWMTADEALAHGFVDEVKEPMKVAACAGLDDVAKKLGFQKMPTIAAFAEPPAEPTWEETFDSTVNELKAFAKGTK